MYQSRGAARPPRMTAPSVPISARRGARSRGGPTAAVWREQVITEADQTQFTLASLGAQLAPELRAEIEGSLDMARSAALDTGLGWLGRRRSSFGGASMERAWGAVDAANEALLRDAPDDYVIGQLPRIRRRVQDALGRDDSRRTELEAVPVATPVTAVDREVVVAAFHAANCEERRKHARVRSFRNMLHLCGIVLTIAALGSPCSAGRGRTSRCCASSRVGKRSARRTSSPPRTATPPSRASRRR